MTLQWTEFINLVSPLLSRLDGAVDTGTVLEDAGLDSLSLVELVAEVETRWQIEFPLEALNWDTFATAGSLYDVTAALVAAAQ